ncbi:MAG: hypothetical protein JST20_12870 [Bacteroidetes bacterium]|nr:hypothetical protein [Bacteroidota bacterium]
MDKIVYNNIDLNLYDFNYFQSKDKIEMTFLSMSDGNEVLNICCNEILLLLTSKLVIRKNDEYISYYIGEVTVEEVSKKNALLILNSSNYLIQGIAELNEILPNIVYSIKIVSGSIDVLIICNSLIINDFIHPKNNFSSYIMI